MIQRLESCRPSALRLRLWLLALLGAAGGQAAGFLVDFKSAGAMAGWNFENGAEFPGGRGSLGLQGTDAERCAELSYDFTPPKDSRAPFNPQYVLATTAIPPALSEGASRIRLKIRLSSPTLVARLRVRDQAGETFQYDLAGMVPLTGTSPEAWAVATVELARPEQHWAGPGDESIHFPLRQLAILLDAEGAHDRGWLRFKEVELLGPPAPAAIRLDGRAWIPPPLEPDELSPHAGINVHFLQDEAALDLIREAGFGWIRTDLEWNEIERRRESYNFAAFATLVDSASRRHLRVLAILDYGNTIHTGGAMKPPRSPAAIRAYAAFCEAAARHFAGRGVVFEIWNEPDVDGFWDNAPDAAEYAAVLRAGIDAVKRGDPKARVITGGLSAPYDVTYRFWDVLQRKGAMAGADGWGAHLYGTSTPEVRWTDLRLLDARAELVMPGQRIWCTEWGFSSTKLSPAADGHSAPARMAQATRFVRQLLVGWWANLPLNVLYEFRDSGDDAGDPEDNFGLVTQNGSAKPALVAVRFLLASSRGRRFGALCADPDLPDGVHIARLDGLTRLFIVWLDETAGPARVQLPDPQMKAFDMFGRRIFPAAPGDAAIALAAKDGPLYVETSE